MIGAVFPLRRAPSTVISAVASAKEIVLSEQLYELIPPPQETEEPPRTMVSRDDVPWTQRWTQTQYRTDPDEATEDLVAQLWPSPAFSAVFRIKAGYLLAARAEDRLPPPQKPGDPLAVELTDAGRALAAPLLADEQARVLAEQRATTVRVLPLIPPGQADEAHDRPVELDGIWHLACRGDYVIRLDGTTCLQLWNTAGQVTRMTGDPLQVAQWLQACHGAGIAVRMQINESTTPEAGTLIGAVSANDRFLVLTVVASAKLIPG